MIIPFLDRIFVKIIIRKFTFTPRIFINKIEKKGGQRFKLCGNLPKLIQGAFEDKLIKNEGAKLSEDEANKLG